MDTFHKSFFSIFMISAARFGILRFWSLIPLWLYGPLVVLNPWWRLGHLNRGRCLAYAMAARQLNYCYEMRGTKDWTFGGGLGKIMGMFVIILLASQDVLIFPVAAFPRYLAAPAIILCRFFQPAKNKPQVTKWAFNFEELLSQTQGDNAKALGMMLRDDNIVGRVARHLHYDDVINLSLTSKLMRTSIFYPSPEAPRRRNRVESVCVASCIDGQKTECWGCERVICFKCTHQRSDIQLSRVEDHFANCYAVCIYCYLMSAPRGAAPFQAKRNMQDLELQHINCCTVQSWTDQPSRR
ncbi:hypothetical protein FSHL1_008325 [Fusarium sambucinum]